jgi:PAS domain S-box-containing protein
MYRAPNAKSVKRPLTRVEPGLNEPSVSAKHKEVQAASAGPLSTPQNKINSRSKAFLTTPSDCIERLARMALQREPGGAWNWYLKTNEVVFSPRWKALLGYRSDELTNHFDTFLNLLHPEDVATMRHATSRALDNPSDRTKFKCLFRIYHKNGQLRWFHGWGRTLSDPQGIPYRIMGYSIDVTEQQQAKALLEKLDRYRDLMIDAGSALAHSLDVATLMRTIGTLCVPTLANWSFLSLEHAWLTATQLRAQDPVMQNFLCHENTDCEETMQRWLNPNRSELCLDAVLRRLAPSNKMDGLRIKAVDVAALHRWAPDSDDREALLEAGMQAILRVPLMVHGQMLGSLFLVRSHALFDKHDVEAAKLFAQRAAMALENAKLYAMTTRAVQHREDIMAVVSHDLKSPLTAITLRCERVARRLARSSTNPHDPVYDIVAQIGQDAERMQRLIHSVLDMAKMQGGMFHLVTDAYDATTLLDDARHHLLPLAESRGVTLSVVAESNLGVIACDAERMGQVFANLVENAIKFSPRGGHVMLQANKVANTIQFAVSDDGPGIAPEDVGHLFDRLWQDPKTAAQGTGLGLYIAQNLVEAHGGVIAVKTRTQAPSGTTFSFRIGRALTT